MSDQFKEQPLKIRLSKMHNSLIDRLMIFQLHSEDEVWPQCLEVNAKEDRQFLQSRDGWLGD